MSFFRCLYAIVMPWVLLQLPSVCNYLLCYFFFLYLINKYMYCTKHNTNKGHHWSEGSDSAKWTCICSKSTLKPHKVFLLVLPAAQISCQNPQILSRYRFCWNGYLCTYRILLLRGNVHCCLIPGSFGWKSGWQCWHLSHKAKNLHFLLQNCLEPPNIGYRNKLW